jgi:hypothetical protein
MGTPCITVNWSPLAPDPVRLCKVTSRLVIHCSVSVIFLRRVSHGGVTLVKELMGLCQRVLSSHVSSSVEELPPDREPFQ